MYVVLVAASKSQEPTAEATTETALVAVAAEKKSTKNPNNKMELI